MTAGQILDLLTDGSADDWVYWVYVCDDRSGTCARAVHRERREIGLAWSPARDGEVSHLSETTAPLPGEDRVYHWVELLCDGVPVERQLAAWLDEKRVSLPVPSPGPRGDAGRPIQVSRCAWQLLRLANRIDPDCEDFDAVFEESGIEVR